MRARPRVLNGGCFTKNDKASAPASEYGKLADAAAEELQRIHGGNREYLAWLETISPFWVRVTAYASIEVEHGLGVLPVPVFKTLLGVMVELHRHAHAQWLERDWFELMSRPSSPHSH